MATLGAFLLLLLLLPFFSNSSLACGEEGTVLISHKVAASFLAESVASLVLATVFGELLVENSAQSLAKEGDFVVAVFHVGTGVVDPAAAALFPTKIARLNLYFWIKDDDEDDEPPLFLILQAVLLPFASISWCFCHDIVSFIIKTRMWPQSLKLDPISRP